ncbi:hypothetical protein A7X12_05520 [Sphingomonas sp. TDK1]|nr:hypothetical protein A7X12_05520 [Sphingomonas sp. TDK1]
MAKVQGEGATLVAWGAIGGHGTAVDAEAGGAVLGPVVAATISKLLSWMSGLWSPACAGAAASSICMHSERIDEKRSSSDDPF